MAYPANEAAAGVLSPDKGGACPSELSERYATANSTFARSAYAQNSISGAVPTQVCYRMFFNQFTLFFDLFAYLVYTIIRHLYSTLFSSLLRAKAITRSSSSPATNRCRSKGSNHPVSRSHLSSSPITSRFPYKLKFFKCSRLPSHTTITLHPPTKLCEPIRFRRDVMHSLEIYILRMQSVMQLLLDVKTSLML